MVLQSSNVHAKRLDENKPPVHDAIKLKSIHSRQRSRARAPGNPRLLNLELRRRTRTTASASPSPQVRFEIPAALAAPLDVEMADGTSPPPVMIPKTTVTFPRHLMHPATKQISKEVLAAVEPELAEIPVEYLHGVLQEAGPHMLRMLAGITPVHDRHMLPKELEIIINDISGEVPTHMLAVYSRIAAGERRKVTLYPTHNVVLAVHCANLPSLPPSHPETPTTTGTRVTVPVVPLCLPSPLSFPHLQTYMYTKRPDMLLAWLLPCLPPPFDEMDADKEARQKAAIKQYSAKLAATYTPNALLQYTTRVGGLWRNLCALGIYEDGVWATIDLAWEVLMYALALATGNSQAIEVSPAAPCSS